MVTTVQYKLGISCSNYALIYHESGRAFLPSIYVFETQMLPKYYQADLGVDGSWRTHKSDLNYSHHLTISRHMQTVVRRCYEKYQVVNGMQALPFVWYNIVSVPFLIITLSCSLSSRILLQERFKVQFQMSPRTHLVLTKKMEYDSQSCCLTACLKRDFYDHIHNSPTVRWFQGIMPWSKDS